MNAGMQAGLMCVGVSVAAGFERPVSLRCAESAIQRRNRLALRPLAQRNRSRRDARLKTSCYDLAFEFIAVAPATATGPGHLNVWM